VALDGPFKNTAAGVGVGVGSGLGVGEGVDGVGVGDSATTRVWARRMPTDAVTSAVSLAVNVAVAEPLPPVETCAGATLPCEVEKSTTTFGSAAPFSFWTWAVRTAVPASVPLPVAALSVIWAGTAALPGVSPDGYVGFS